MIAVSTAWCDSGTASGSFNRDIRPILSENCFRCHGPDSGARQAELRLDLEQAALADRGGYAAIVPGRPDDSELIRRIVSDDPSEQMPPPESGKSLTPAEIAQLKRWIEQGAGWEGHWAFIPPVRPAMPEWNGDSGVRNPIDDFIRAALDKQQLPASPPADRRTLIRRLSFDLIGLPPTPDEVDAFVADSRPDAYDRLVERLLASPHFGERMAVHWLDLVRYADSVGYHGDQSVSVWPYRDYVINAFNANTPFDQFTLEQLAGDLLPHPDRQQLVATTYNRLNMMTAEGGAQDKEYLAKYAADRVRTTGSVWLGATIGCAECHDHKFDPFTMNDFYSFAAFFADIKEKGFYGGAHESGNWGPKILVPSPEQKLELDGLDERIASVQHQLNTSTPQLEQAQREWEQRAVGPEVDWATLAPDAVRSNGGMELKVLDDGSVLCTGNPNEPVLYTLDFTVTDRQVETIRLEALCDDRLPQQGPGRAADGNFVLLEFRIKAGGIPVSFAQSHASASPDGFEVAAAIDGDEHTGWAVRPQTGQPHFALFRLAQPLRREAGEAPLAFQLELRQPQQDSQVLGRFRIAVANRPDAIDVVQGETSGFMEILALPPHERSGPQQEQLAAFYRSAAPELDTARRALRDLNQERERLVEQMPTTLVCESVEPRTMRVFPRGNWMDESGPIVSPAVPEFLAPSAGDDRQLARQDLAQWLTSRENPLAARAFVNRLWRLYFGRGLSKVLDDLGAQGEWPTHPDLLDWLAVEFMESGWDIKHIIRTIVTSAAYRQSSTADPDVLARDPYNRWLARQARFRLNAEMIRDNALSVSGLLVERIGGRSARPYQPAGYYAQLNFPSREYQPDTDENQFRRGVYTHWQRTFLHPMLSAFDAPNREECTAERPRSNTPLGALVLLNDPSFVEAARVLAERTLREGGENDADRLNWMYRRVLSRPPGGDEQVALTRLVSDQRARYQSEPEAARKLCETGIVAPTEGLDVSELAAWTSVARTLLNLHETVTRN